MGSDPAGGRVKVSRRKRNPPKVPRKVHKAVREKQKRDEMNELFLNLGEVVELDQPINGKASILKETIRLLGQLLAVVDNLKKENVNLITESNYVEIEKKELLDEVSVLNDQLKLLQTKIDEKVKLSSTYIPKPQKNATAQLHEDHLAFLHPVGHGSQPTSSVGPVLIMPLDHASQGLPEPFSDSNLPKSSLNVSRPCPRYPSASDSWPSQVLSEQT